MNRHRHQLHNYISLLIITLITPSLLSCSSDLSDTAEKLLETVPSSSAGVAVVNVETVVENAGAKVSGDKIEFKSVPAYNLNENLKYGSDSDRLLFSLLFGEDTGLEPSVVVAFMDANKLVYTGLIADTDNFRATVERLTASKFSKEKDIEMCGAVALTGNQFWIFNKSADASKVNEWSSLSSHQSYASNDNIDALKECKHAVAGKADIAAYINSMAGGFQKTATMQMALSALFDDAAFVDFNVDFKKNVCDVSAVVMNSKGKPAKLNLPFEKINTADITSMQGSAQAYAAINISTRLVEKINDMFRQLGGLPLNISSIIGDINGTCVVKAGDKTNMYIRIPVKGTDTSALQSMLEQYGNVSRADGYVRVAGKQPVAGTIRAEEAAKFLNGAYMGFMANPAVFSNPDINIASMAFAIRPSDDGGVAINIRLEGKNTKSGFLQQVIE